MKCSISPKYTWRVSDRRQQGETGSLPPEGREPLGESPLVPNFKDDGFEQAISVDEACLYSAEELSKGNGGLCESNRLFQNLAFGALMALGGCAGALLSPTGLPLYDLQLGVALGGITASFLVPAVAQERFGCVST